MKNYFLSLLTVSLLAGCMGSTPNQLSPKLSEVSSGTAGTISYCRPTSVMRLADTVEIYIGGDKSQLNGQLAAKIKNGSSGRVAINSNENFSFGLKSSLLFMRSSEQIAFSDAAMSKKDRYFIVKGKPNYGQGAAILLGGVFGAAAVETEDTGKSNWSVTSVTKSEFETTCK